MIARRLLIAVVALLLAVQVVRVSAVLEYADLRPDTAARFWPDHPDVELSHAMIAIGRSARERRQLAPSIFATVDDAASKAPLAPDPYLVRGVQAQVRGDAQAAHDAFAAAQLRDPRSLPAAYFLADYDLRNGQLADGLRETALLARLSPSGTSVVAPFVASYAQNPSNWPQIRALFRSNTELEEGALQALAPDPRNADAILALADPAHRNASSQWLPTLLQALANGGDYAKAHAIWASVAGVNSAGALLYDPGFAHARAPPPFNWTLASSTLGLAERQPAGRLHVIFYGQDDGPLASQLLLLPPGSYRLHMTLQPGAVHPEALSWSIRCDKGNDALATVPLEAAATRGWTFQVPAGCNAQWLELLGRSGDVTQQSEVTIAALGLDRGNGGA